MAAMTLGITGAAGTVTGSHFVVDTGAGQFLLDCGMYQGAKEWRERNWEPFPIQPSALEAVVLSHGHVDHTGYLPRLMRDGFRGKVYATAPTRDLAAILLPDSARLMEEEAEYRNRKRISRHKPALPLYTEADAERAAERITALSYHESQSLPGGAQLRLLRAGHLLGSAMVELHASGVTLLYSGDLGRPQPVLLRPRERVRAADYVLLESTYGSRAHAERDPREPLERAVKRIVLSRGTLVIPSFAVGRTQEVLFLLRELEDSDRIPAVPVYVDSPMATDASTVLLAHLDELRPEVAALGTRAIQPRHLRFVRTVAASKALNTADGPMIVIAGSGMATGGRVLHHLLHRLPDKHNGVLLVGYQPAGGRGRQMLDGAATISIFHEQVPVRAQVNAVDALSAHADADEIIEWLGGFERPPRRTFLVHGEDDARAALATRIREELGWEVSTPALGERVPLV